jgi:hypothetical protein
MEALTQAKNELLSLTNGKVKEKQARELAFNVNYFLV